MMLNKTFRIIVKTVTGTILNFKGVNTYEVIDGFVTFTNPVDGRTKRFSSSNTEIEEER